MVELAAKKDISIHEMIGELIAAVAELDARLAVIEQQLADTSSDKPELPKGIQYDE
jgi:hypothetical protein